MGRVPAAALRPAVWMRAERSARLRPEVAELHQAGLAEVQPAHFGFGLEDEGVQHQEPGGVGRALEAAVSRRDLVYSCSARMDTGALGLDDGADVGPGNREAEGELDGQFVPGRTRAGYRGREPGAGPRRARPR